MEVVVLQPNVPTLRVVLSVPAYLDTPEMDLTAQVTQIETPLSWQVSRFVAMYMCMLNYCLAWNK